MHPKLKTLKIEKLFGHKDIELHFNDVTVLVGKNGLGKTTLLKILHALLLRESCSEIDECQFAELTFTNDQTIKFGSKKLPNSKDKVSDINDELSRERKALINILGFSQEKRSAEEIDESIKNEDFAITLKVLGELFNIIRSKFFIESELLAFMKEIAKVEFISTINMSANSQQVITGSDGRQGNFLDWEIEKEIAELVKTPKGKHTLLFLKELNRHFSDSEKKVQIREGLKVITRYSKNPLPVNKLSSGERQLLYIMAKVANTRSSPAFLLMDEPEISLHLNWQEKLIDSIKTMNPNCQIVIVTHSPAIIMDGYMDSYVDMESIVTGEE